MHPEIDRFAHLDSLLHRWDPRWKLVAFLLVLVAMGLPGARFSGTAPAWSDELPAALVCLATSVACVHLAGIPLFAAIRRLRGAAFLLLLVFVIFALSFPDDRRPAGVFGVSDAGLVLGTSIVLRAFAMLLLIFPAFGTTRFDRTMKALRDLGVPRPLVQIVLFTYRYLFVYLDQVRKLQLAMRTRGFRPATDRHTLRTLGNGIGMLLVGSIERTERIHNAMRCRGLGGTMRTLDAFRTRPSDVALFACGLTWAVAFVAWRFA